MLRGRTGGLGALEEFGLDPEGSGDCWRVSCREQQCGLTIAWKAHGRGQEWWQNPERNLLWKFQEVMASQNFHSVMGRDYGARLLGLNPALPLSSCVTLGQLFNLSVPQILAAGRGGGANESGGLL